MTNSKVLGKGAYGCVFKPALNCVNMKKFENDLGKIMFNYENYKEESEISNILKKIDPNNDYLLFPIDKKCNVVKNVIVKNDPSNKCDIFDKSYLTYGQLIMKDGGISLMDYKFKLNRKSLLKLLLNLFLGVELLIKNKLIHQDIKLDNVVIGDKVKLIDFGLLTSFKDFPTNFMLNVEYFLNGPEYRIKFITDFMNLKNILISNLVTYCFYDKWIKDGLSPYDVENLEVYFNNHKDIIPEKADIYSLGVLIMCLYNMLIPANLDDPYIVAKFNKLISDMIKPNPSDRISIKDIIKNTKEIISTSLKINTPIITNKSKSPKLPNSPKEKILNPKSGRYVLITSKIGKELLKGKVV